MSAKHKNDNSTLDNILIGEYLKIQREKKGISLEYISAQTKINYNVLKNLENDNLKELPNIAYLKGFVQHYVKILETDLQEALDRLDYSYNLKSTNDKESLNHQHLVTPQVLSTSAKAIGNTREETFSDQMVSFFDTLVKNKKTISIVSGIAVVFFGIYGAYKYINENVAKNIELPKTTKTVVTENESHSNEIKPIDSNLLESDKLKEVRNEVTKADAKTTEVKVEETKKEVVAKTEIKTEPKSEEIKKLTPSDKFPFVKFRKISASKIYTVLEEAAENTNSEIFPEDIRSKHEDGKQSLYITAVTEKTWLSYTIDEGEVVTRILKPGQNLFIQGEEIAIFLGNVNATKVFYNNKLIDPLSKTGVKSLIFPEEKIGEYYLPLFKANTDGVLYKSKDYISRMKDEETDSVTN